ncbi:hypothetical protein [Pseudozobellia sp. WGM2]|uniref:hypothetical protein n=1 Tax=Pseudozobellia sp. WGM2 TaxID=2787625 RepID=UPI001AE046AE|nr:hypothetical protein [Pseudozobellia sp. WGM2]
MKNLLSLAILFFSLSLFAQYEYPEKKNADIVLQSTLAVQLLNDDDAFGKSANAAVQQIFEENWKLTEVVFLSKTEIEKLKASKDSKYAYLTHDEGLLKETRMNHISTDPNSTTFGRSFGMGVNAPTKSISYQRVAFTFAYYSYNLEIIGTKKKPESVTQIGFANGELSKIDYLFLCQQLTHLIDSAAKEVPQKEYYSIERNIEKNQNSQLILPKAFFKDKDLEKMNSYYEYDFELVDVEKYQNVILNKEKGKTYVKIIWSHQHSMYLWTVVDAEDGAIIAQTGFGGVKFGKNHKANEIIKAKHLKYITSKMAQKVNSRYK